MAAGTSANLGPVSNYINTLLPAADAKTARQTLLLDGQSSDLASAASINLDTTTGDLLDLTGNASVSTITLAQGVEKTLRVTGTPTFVNGSNLLLPGGVNIVGASGDIVVFRGYASGVVRCVQYQRNSGFPLATLGDGLGTATPNGVPTLIGIPRNYKSGFIQSTAGASATMTT